MVKEHLFATITYILTPLQLNLVEPDPLFSIFIIIIVTSHTARLGCLWSSEAYDFIKEITETKSRHTDVYMWE